MKIKRTFRSLVAIVMVVIIIILSSIAPVAASGRNQFYLAFLYNPDARTFSSMVVQNSSRRSMEEDFSRLNTNDSTFRLEVGINLPLTIVSPGKMLPQQATLSYLPFTFPEFPDVEGTMTDRTMATNVGVQLTTSFNTAIQTILRPVSLSGRRALGIDNQDSFFQMAMAISNSAHNVITSGNTSFVSEAFGQLTWSIRRATQGDMDVIRGMPMGLTYSDYVVVRNRNGETAVLPYFIPKGYSQGQQLFGQQVTSVSVNEITPKLSWAHVVILSNSHLRQGGTVQNPGTVVREDAFSRIIAGFLGVIINLIAVVLGLSPVEDLMFNAGTRSATHYFGLFPMSWLQPINMLNLVSTVIALVVIGISIVKMLIRRNLSTITPSVKADLMEGVKDLFMVAVGVSLFMPFLFIILSFNDTIVAALRSMAPGGAVLGLARGTGTFGIAESIMQIAYLFILLVINVMYLIRAVTLAMLIGFAPVFISLFAAGGAAKKISTTWLKEMIANIFMQTFNAAMLLVFMNIGAFGSLSLIERFALLISFIPLTKFFKGGLMNLGSGSDAIGEKTSGAFANLATSMAAGALVSKVDGKSERNGKVVRDGISQVDSAKTSGSSSGMPRIQPGADSSGTQSGLSVMQKGKEALRGGADAIGQGINKAANTVAKGVENPKEVGRLLGKGAMIGAGAGISLGSAAAGGSPLAGKAIVASGVQSAMNQLEGWSRSGGEGPVTAAGSELREMGVSGFENENIFLSSDARSAINDSPSSQQEFLSKVQAYNELNPDSRAEVFYDDTKRNINRVKIPGVSGKTISMKDPETGKFMSSESTFYGAQKVKNFSAALERGASTPPAQEGPKSRGSRDDKDNFDYGRHVDIKENRVEGPTTFEKPHTGVEEINKASTTLDRESAGYSREDNKDSFDYGRHVDTKENRVEGLATFEKSNPGVEKINKPSTVLDRGPSRPSRPESLKKGEPRNDDNANLSDLYKNNK